MKITVLSDASYCPKYKVAGYGFWIACARGKLGGGGKIIEEVEDTNAAEMMAICNSIWHGVSEELILRGDELLVQTDSLAAIDRLRGQRVVTLTDQQNRIIAYYEKVVRRLDLKVVLRHVKGHTGNREARFVANRMCDKRAKDHMRAARSAKIAEPYIQQIREMLT
mgnify:CR=1 FL=1